MDTDSPIPLTSALRVHPVTDWNGGTVSLPGSKSITNRALIMASLATGRSVLRNVLDCEDSRYLVEALGNLGVLLSWDTELREIELQGAGGPYPCRDGTFYCGNAGTTVRFLTAALAACGGNYRVDGSERMRERPIDGLVRGLVELGAQVRAPGGYPPIEIGSQPLVGGRVGISGHVSSQFISAILMASPLAQQSVEVRVTGELVSTPYIELTLAGMRDFGATVTADYKRADGQPLYRVVAGRGYEGRDYTVEGDASSASYFYAAAAVTGSTLRVEGVGKESVQGDSRCADVLAAMGCRVTKERDAVIVTGPPGGLPLKGVDWDCSDIPDVVPTLAVVGLFARGKTRLRGVAHLRHNESARIRSVATGLQKLGGSVRELADGLEVEGSLGPRSAPLHGATIDTWGDHRIAMAFAVAGLQLPDVVIREPYVVAKSFPTFFDMLSAFGVTVESTDGASGEPTESKHGEPTGNKNGS